MDNHHQQARNTCLFYGRNRYVLARRQGFVLTAKTEIAYPSRDRRLDRGFWISSVSYCSRYASLLYQKVGAYRLRVASRMKIKRKIRDKYKIRRIFVGFAFAFQNGGSVAAQSPISRRGSSFSFGGQYETLSPRQDASISTIK